MTNLHIAQMQLFEEGQYEHSNIPKHIYQQQLITELRQINTRTSFNFNFCNIKSFILNTLVRRPYRTGVLESSCVCEVSYLICSHHFHISYRGEFCPQLRCAKSFFDSSMIYHTYSLYFTYFTYSGIHTIVRLRTNTPKDT